VRTLEETGYIGGYHADIDARKLGFEVQVFAMVGLQSQAEADLSAFEMRCLRWPLVRECHMLNGEVDFILKCVAPDLSTFRHPRRKRSTRRALRGARRALVKTTLSTAPHLRTKTNRSPYVAGRARSEALWRR